MGPYVEYMPRGIRFAPKERAFASNAVLGMVLFLLAELMFFTGLISAYLVLRSGAGVWPPPGQPRLPIEATAVNTLLLLASGVTMVLARGRALCPAPSAYRGWLAATLLLGAAFVAIQGFEWVRLIGYGLTTNSSIYGGTFYLLIGVHALHVLGGLAVLVYALRKTRGFLPAAGRGRRLTVAAMYWLFVVLLWPVLYGLVYF
ncbi:MAG: heme-copper oxidase subunit III [Deltaproteobacteria bacterium]|nr:heme-copper oxidase subunit III [Deltaproteobacteria bacterium]